jgi:hypothetical protein
MNTNQHFRKCKLFWFHEIPPFWIVVLIISAPSIFGTLYLYPFIKSKLSKNNYIKFLQLILLFIFLLIINFTYNQILKFIFKW